MYHELFVTSGEMGLYLSNVVILIPDPSCCDSFSVSNPGVGPQDHPHTVAGEIGAVLAVATLWVGGARTWRIWACRNTDCFVPTTGKWKYRHLFPWRFRIGHPGQTRPMLLKRCFVLDKYFCMSGSYCCITHENTMARTCKMKQIRSMAFSPGRGPLRSALTFSAGLQQLIGGFHLNIKLYPIFKCIY